MSFQEWHDSPKGQATLLSLSYTATLALVAMGDPPLTLGKALTMAVALLVLYVLLK